VLKVKNSVFVAVSEGIRDDKGKFVSQLESTAGHDKFGHVQLGGVCSYLKNALTENKVASKVKTLELGITQRCAMHNASQQDIDEAYRVGQDGVKYSAEGKTGYMVGITRLNNKPYEMGTNLIKASDVSNNIKHFPKEWITAEGNNIIQEGIDYILPLIMGSPNIKIENGLPIYASIDKSRIIEVNK
jgi:6-phosphofructokinase 1